MEAFRYLVRGTLDDFRRWLDSQADQILQATGAAAEEFAVASCSWMLSP